MQVNADLEKVNLNLSIAVSTFQQLDRKKKLSRKENWIASLLGTCINSIDCKDNICLHFQEEEFILSKW